MALAEAAEDRKNSTGEALQAQEVALDRHTSPRGPLQHRPVSMPLEKLLQGQLSLASPDQGKPDPITDTLIGESHSYTNFCPDSPKNIVIKVCLN